MEKQIEIRDARKRQMFRIDDLYIDKYARFCGANATAVYCSLCRHSNGAQVSYPSIEKLMEQHGISKHTIIKAIRSLENFGIIRVTRSKDKKTKRQQHNIYTLLDVAKWSEPSAKNALGAGCKKCTEPGAKYDKKPGAPDAPEGYTEEKVTHRRNVAQDATPPVQQCKDEKCGNVPMRDREYCNIHQSMDLEQFVEWCASSPHKHVQIIGEWADTVHPKMTTVAQWESYIVRNVRPAKLLIPFTQDQLEEGFAQIEKGIKEGWLTDYSLETLFKKITNAKA